MAMPDQGLDSVEGDEFITLAIKLGNPSRDK
jgi:hypothetical protein